MGSVPEPEHGAFRVGTVDTDTERFRTLSNALLDLPTENDVVDEVGKLWAEAQEKFLTIGRYLVRAKARFPRTFEATILPQLPFGRGVAPITSGRGSCGRRAHR